MKLGNFYVLTIIFGLFYFTSCSSDEEIPFEEETVEELSNSERDYLLNLVMPNNTPYSLSKEFQTLSTEEKTNALNEAKEKYGWERITEKSDYLLTLQ